MLVPRVSRSSRLCRRFARCVPLCVALGLCGGFALQPLWAEPPQSASAASTGAPAAPARDITVTGQHPVVIGRDADTGKPCVSAEVAGQRAGTTDCAAARLQDATRAAQRAASADPTLAMPHARSGDATVGVGSLTGSSQRLGVDLRNATHLPQRPPPPVFSSPYPRRP